MLEICHISKKYQTGELIQQALDDVSLNLRDNEFVAVLGPSGSGKTTLLNIIGGLDRYDTGDLIINGVSTKKYRDRDWDSYRNHTIGFVFQSYNLIPHQTILANVELALTIGGVSRDERRRKAMRALAEVGLADQAHKKPNQMSGGQMQRVAIARALVNDPDILLADEPTGALDSDTSLQVMDLLKDVARDRLVVMVTHNPELAEKYATRIVKLRDGRIISDSMPYEIQETGEAVHKNLGKASMSFLTALSLSFNNLRTKMARTILVAFAGSIGIIGIALILSLANGVNDYIADVEEETLSEYPIEIDSSTYSMSSMLQRAGDASDKAAPGEGIHEVAMVTSILSNVTSNDLSSLKKYIESGESGLEEYVNAIEYDYGITPLIYRLDDDGSYRKVNPDESLASLGISSASSSNSLMSTMMSTDQFYSLPQSSSLYENEYRLEAGRWPENSHELVLVLNSMGNVSDFLLYMVGLKDSDELDEMVDEFSRNETVETERSSAVYTSEDFLGITFKMVMACDLYAYDGEYNVWTDKSTDDKYLRELIENGTDLTIVGVVKPSEKTTAAMLTTGIYYPYELYEEIMDYAAHSDIVLSQLEDEDINVFTGKAFGDTEEVEIDFSKMISIDEDAFAGAFSLDLPSFNGIDISPYLDMSSLTGSLSGASLDMSALMSQIKINVTQEGLTTLFKALLEGYEEYEKEHPEDSLDSLMASFKTYLSSEEAQTILQADLKELLINHVSVNITSDMVREIVMQAVAAWQTSGYPQIEDYLNSAEGQQMLGTITASLLSQTSFTDISEEELMKVLTDIYEGYEAYAEAGQGITVETVEQGFFNYLSTDRAQSVITEAALQMIDTSALEKAMASQMSAMTSAMVSSMSKSVSSAVSAAMSSYMRSFTTAFTVDTDAIVNAFQFTADEQELSQLLSAMMYSSSSDSAVTNLAALNYASDDDPDSILIYPKNFEAKEEILNILDAYSERMREEGHEEKAITYIDLVGTLMSSVTTIVDAISYVLIAFVAISLIVSSIMIGVITYISVLERKKEIGILRAIGASKRNISSVFNAETFIIGLLAGLIGVIVTLLLLIPINRFIYMLAGRPINGSLPIISAGILVVLSVVLTLIGGIIPSRKAARSDPVEALRTE